jgi:hypothetical protein
MSRRLKVMGAYLLGSFIVFPTAVLADSAPVAKPATVANSAPQTQSETDEKRKSLMADATSAIQETQDALKYLDEDKTKDALAALERATGKLDVILARDPKLELAPASIAVVTYDVQGGLDAVQRVREQAEHFMQEGRLQDARRLLKNLASETVISVNNIPLATYPDAIKASVRLIDQAKKEDAKRLLQTALNTQVITETIIPLPVAKTQEALKTAESLAEKKDRTKEDNEHLKTAMDEAQHELEFAQALGYGGKKDFDTMYQQLAEIQDKTSGNKSGTDFFEKIKASIADFMRSTQRTKSG